MSLTDQELTILGELKDKKSKFIVLVKWRYPFYTRLENLKKPNNCALIGVFAEEVREKLFEDYEKHFDLILWFHADYSKVAVSYSDPECIDVPIVDEIIGRITQIVPSNNIRILECEEVMIDVLCRVRARYSVPGAKPGDLDYLRNKGMLKEACVSKGIPTTRFMIVDFKQNKSCEELIEELERAIGSYPMFRKPIKGFGSGGGGILGNSDELKQWINEMSGQSVVYLIEECIHKRELWAFVILLQSGKWAPIFNLNCGHRTVRQMLENSDPIPFIGERFEDCADEFPNLAAFVDDVIQKLKPPAPHVFCIQAFQLEPRTNKYLFTECGYRLNGARGCGITYKSAGISQETAFLSTYMNPEYEPKADVTSNTYSVWYPYLEGTLRSHSELPENAPIKCKVEFDWKVPVGTKLFKASTFDHFVLSLELTHEDKKVVEEGLKYFLDVWRPDVA